MVLVFRYGIVRFCRIDGWKILQWDPFPVDLYVSSHNFKQWYLIAFFISVFDMGVSCSL